MKKTAPFMRPLSTAFAVVGALYAGTWGAEADSFYTQFNGATSPDTMTVRRSTVESRLFL